MQLVAAVVLFGLATANNVMSPYAKKYLDIKAMCAECDDAAPLDDEKDGCDRKGCDRQEPSIMGKSTRMHMWTCHNDENEDFELIFGRAKNKAAGRTSKDDAELCIDIEAMCADCYPSADLKGAAKGCDSKGCKRQTLDQIKADAEAGGEAEIQLWTCRDDASNSSFFGNQKWDLLGNGLWKNAGASLCLVANHDDAESVAPWWRLVVAWLHLGTVGGADATSGAEVHVRECPYDSADGLAEFVFDFETGDLAEQSGGGASEGRRRARRGQFSVGAMAAPSRASSRAPLVGAASGALALAAAAAAAARPRFGASERELPLATAE
ncbi:unnamed protein product [Prorocentrum cordatum]|uniref:Cellulase n=1 Tax=Prorocentrum cordatum TaxID=2364126 RepID=A0ABN9W0Q3_9DINO|nr:unnamed protein product [Polarella glacialis]